MHLLQYLLLLVFLTFKIKADQSDGIQPRIIDGHPAGPNEIPYQVELYYQGEPICSGALVQSPTTKYHFILTSNACTVNRKDGTPVRDDRLEIIAGVTDRFATSKPDQQIVLNREIVRHPNAPKVDIAILLPKRQFYETQAVKPIVLPPEKDYYPDAFTPLTVSGWGSSKKGDDNNRTNHLQVTDVKTCKWVECRINQEVGRDALCAWDYPSEGHEKVCWGDWGAPAVTTYPTTKVRYVAGIFSWNDKGCETTKKPTVFVSVSAVLDWVNEVDKQFSQKYKASADD